MSVSQSIVHQLASRPHRTQVSSVANAQWRFTSQCEHPCSFTHSAKSIYSKTTKVCNRLCFLEGGGGSWFPKILYETGWFLRFCLGTRVPRHSTGGMYDRPSSEARAETTCPSYTHPQTNSDVLNERVLLLACSVLRQTQRQ